MRNLRITPLLAAALVAIPTSRSSIAAQQTASAADTVAPDTTHKKHGGLFGKAKKLMGDKTVQAVGKAVACTMVPGGSAIAGAMDAASHKSVGEAVATASGAASGAPCIPGGLGGAGLAGAAGRLAGGVTGNLAGAGALAATEAALASGGRDAPTVSGYAPGASALTQEDMARCMGLTPQEYRDFADPTHGAARTPTKAETKRQQQLAQKVDARGYQACIMAQQPPAPPAAEMPAVEHASAPVPADVVMSPDLVGELRKGRTALRQIGWESGGSELADGAGAAFGDAMSKLALALRQAGGRYRVDIYVEQAMDKTTAARIGAARLQVVRDALDHAGLPPDIVTTGKAKADKDPRLELVRIKK